MSTCSLGAAETYFGAPEKGLNKVTARVKRPKNKVVRRIIAGTAKREGLLP
jgi:hypothetical protein